MSVRRSARMLPRSNKVAAITSTLDSLNQVVATVGEADLSWMDEQLQFLYSRARNDGAPIVSSSASDVAATMQADMGTSVTTLEAEEARIDGLLVRQLKAELSKAGESTDGKKCVLKARLLHVVRRRFDRQNEENMDEARGDDAGGKAAMEEEEENSSRRDEADADPPVEPSPMVMDVEQDHQLGPTAGPVDIPGQPNDNTKKGEQYSHVEAAIQSEGFMRTHVEKQSACEMEIEVTSPPISSSESPLNPSKQQEHSVEADANDMRPLASPKRVKTSDVPCSERKRDRSPTRESPSVLQKLSPNRSMTKVQKVSQWPHSASKLRGDCEGDGRKAVDTVGSPTVQSSCLTTDHAAKAAVVYQATTIVQGNVVDSFQPVTAKARTPNILPSKSFSSNPRIFQQVLSSKVLASGGDKPSYTSQSVLSADARKKNEDRKARLMDIRAKSKAVATTKQLVANAASLTQTFSTFKSAGKTETSGALENPAKLLSQQLREKAKIAVASSNLAPTTMMSSSSNTATSQYIKPTTLVGLQKSSAMQVLKPSTQTCQFPSSASKKPTMAVAGVHKTQMTESLKKPLCASPAPAVSNKQAESRSRSPQTYEMSDEDSVDSEDEDAHAKRAKKYVPQWARSPNLKALLEKQHRRTDVNPDDIFGRVTTCDLEAIFGRQPNKKYNVRSSTGDWAEDCIKPHEQLVQKRPCQA